MHEQILDWAVAVKPACDLQTVKTGKKSTLGFWQITSYLPEGFRQITSSFKLGRANEKAKGRKVKRLSDSIKFKLDMAEKKERQRVKNNYQKLRSGLGRRIAFLNAVRDGQIYGCVCCHRLRFRNGVALFDDDLQDKIKTANATIISKAVGTPDPNCFVKGSYFICLDCKTKLLKGFSPP